MINQKREGGEKEVKKVLRIFLIRIPLFPIFIVTWGFLWLNEDWVDTTLIKKWLKGD